MPLRVAFDVDGVFADMEGALRGLASMSKDQPLSINPVNHSAGTVELTTTERRNVWRCVRRTHNFWETLEEIEPGGLARLCTLSQQRRWHVVFFTQRPRTAGDNAQLQTQRWLEKHGFEHASVLVVPGTRGKLAAALNLDFVIDDVPNYCLDVQLESRAKPCLVWRGDGAALPPGTRRLGIEVFNSVTACLDQLEAWDSRPAKRPTFVQSIQRRLGLKPHTTH